jgi:hypothetical protein
MTERCRDRSKPVAQGKMVAILYGMSGEGIQEMGRAKAAVVPGPGLSDC